MAVHAFGAFDFDTESGELRKGGLRLKLRGQPIEILRQLIARPGEVVTREQLREALWPGGTFVDFDSAMNVAVMKLRQVLNDSAESPRYIETLPKVGYRFIYPVGRAAAPAKVPAELEAVLVPLHRGSAGGWVIPVAALAMLGVIVGACLWLRPEEPRGAALELRQLTSMPGDEESPAVSPKGNLVAFSWRDGEESGIYLMLAEGTERKRLTQVRAPIQDRNPVWSPDGEWLAFVRFSPEGREVWIVSVLGEGPRRVAATNGYFTAFHPGGRDLIVARREAGQSYFELEQVPVAGGAARKFSQPGERVNAYVPFGFSRDGREFAYIEAPPDGGRAALYTRDTGGGERRRRAERQRMIRGFAFEDPEDMIVSSEHEGRFRLERVRGDAAEPVQLATLSDLLSPAAGGGHILFEKREHQRTLHWHGDRGGAFSASTGQDSAPAFSADGKRVAFVSNRQGPLEVWVGNLEDGSARQLTFLAKKNLRVGAPSWSPDGKWVVFDAIEGRRRLYRVPSAGGEPEEFPAADEDALRPVYSADGRFVYYTRKKVESLEIWRRSAEPRGGGEERVYDGSGVDVRLDGDWMYFRASLAPGPLLRAPAGGRGKAEVVRPLVAHGWWDVRQGEVYWVRPMDHAPDRIREREILRGDRVAARFTAKLFQTDRDFAVSPDGKKFLVSQVERNDIDLFAAVPVSAK
jgi:DNA-binding winged helix-turn-helix (wHTH) protein/dipeptidyl aminopeptidase/acylaminoacyl peptidase